MLIVSTFFTSLLAFPPIPLDCSLFPKLPASRHSVASKGLMVTKLVNMNSLAK